MSLIGEDFNIYYNTDENDIVKEFYCKALERAVLYRRAAGFFSSTSLLMISKGISELLTNGGRIELLVSPKLSEEDIEAIKNGYASRKEIVDKNLERSFDIYELEQNKDQYNYLAWLIYEGKLDIKVVVRKDLSNFGIFHDKFGIIYDKDENKVAFHGSMNESETAFIDNYESINVFLSWEARDKLRIENIEQKFNTIWVNKGNKWDTYEFPEAIRNKMLQYRSEERPIFYNKGNDETDIVKEVGIPYNIKLRDYQKEAIKSWLGNGGKGIFEMATGTGKTITGISAMVKIIEQYNKNNIPCGMLVVLPYKVLLEQWDEILKLFNINSIKCYESKESWFSKLSYHINLFNSGTQGNLFFITTNTTFRSNEFQELLCKIKNDYILCIDEMHHFAAEGSLSKLPSNPRFKLGLSATLMTKYDKEKMNRLINYFEKGIIFNFQLDRAIKEGYLTPYYYYPIFVELTDDEKDEYFLISSQIGKKLAYTDIESGDTSLQNLFIKRARLIASAENKINKLLELKSKIKNTYYNLFYCGDKIESDERYIQKVNKALAFDIGIKTHTFTSEESRNTRLSLIQDFSEGKIQALTAIRCLDEGVDIPKLRRAFILSSGTNPKEFIQRRGRILRLSQGKEYAEIYDFIVVPSLNKKFIETLTPQEFKCEQKIILREFERFKEFAELALNKYDAYNEILKVWNLYENNN